MTRTAEEVAAEAWAIARTPNMARDWGEDQIADLIRREREAAFDAGIEAGATHGRGYGDAHEPLMAARRAAIEGEER